MNYNDYFRKALDWFKNEATRVNRWPKEEVGYPHLTLTAAFYEKAECFLHYKVIRSKAGDTSRRLFIASFVRRCGYPKRLGFAVLIHGIVARSNWDDLADNPGPEIDEYKQVVQKKYLTQIERNILEDEDGISALENLLQYLAFLHQEADEYPIPEELVRVVLETHEIDMDEALAMGIYHQYADIIQLKGQRQRRPQPLKINYFLSMDGAVPVKFGLRLKTGKGGACLPRYIPVTNAKLGCTIDNVECLPDVRVQGPILLPADSSGSIELVFTRLQRGFNNVSISIAQYEIAILRRDGVLLFTGEGKEIVGPEVDVPMESDVWALPIDQVSMEDLQRRFKPTIISYQSNPAATVFKLRQEDGKDDTLYISGAVVRFCKEVPDIELSEPTGFSKRFSGRVYSVRQSITIGCRLKSRQPVFVEVYNAASDIKVNGFTVTHTIKQSLNLIPGEYRIDFKVNGTRISFRKIIIIPEFELLESDTNVSVTPSDGWVIGIDCKELEAVGEDKYVPMRKGRFPASFVFTKNAHSFLVQTILDTSPDVEVLKEEEIAIENGDTVHYFDIRNSGMIRFRNRSREGDLLSYTILVKPKTVRFTFPRVFSFRITEPRFYWTRIFEIFNELHPESCSLKIMQDQEFKFQCTIVSSLLVDLERDDASAIILPKKVMPAQEDKPNPKYAFHLHSLLSPWEKPFQTGAMSGEAGKPVLTYRQIPDGIWMIYLVGITENDSDFEVLSRGFFYKKSGAGVERDMRDGLEKALSSLFPTDKAAFLNCGNALFEEGYFTDRKKADLLIRAFENYLAYRPYDFLIYSILPVHYPLIPLWWVYGKMTGTADLHISGRHFPLPLEPFSGHGRFSWLLVRVSDFDRIYYILNSNDTFTEAFLFEMMPILNDDLFWVQWAWILSSLFIEMSQDIRKMLIFLLRQFPSLFKLGVSGSGSFQDAGQECMVLLEQQGRIINPDLDLDMQDDTIRYIVVQALNELSHHDTKEKWTSESLKYFQDSSWKMKLPDLFADKFYPQIIKTATLDGIPRIDRLDPVFRTMMQVAVRDQFFERVPAMTICLAMTAFDIVAYQFDQPTVLDERLRLLLVRIFKENDSDAWELWYTQWLGCRLEEIVAVKLMIHAMEEDEDEHEV